MSYRGGMCWQFYSAVLELLLYCAMFCSMTDSRVISILKILSDLVIDSHQPTKITDKATGLQSFLPSCMHTCIHAHTDASPTSYIWYSLDATDTEEERGSPRVNRNIFLFRKNGIR